MEQTSGSRRRSAEEAAGSGPIGERARALEIQCVHLAARQDEFANHLVTMDVRQHSNERWIAEVQNRLIATREDVHGMPDRVRELERFRRQIETTYTVARGAINILGTLFLATLFFTGNLSVEGLEKLASLFGLGMSP